MEICAMRSFGQRPCSSVSRFVLAKIVSRRSGQDVFDYKSKLHSRFILQFSRHKKSRISPTAAGKPTVKEMRNEEFKFLAVLLLLFALLLTACGGGESDG
jgi:hypothetical protein